jgi:hypothetical protein
LQITGLDLLVERRVKEFFKHHFSGGKQHAFSSRRSHAARLQQNCKEFSPLSLPRVHRRHGLRPRCIAARTRRD